MCWNSYQIQKIRYKGSQKIGKEKQLGGGLMVASQIIHCLQLQL